MYLSTILDDYPCYVIAWKLRTTTQAKNITDTLNLALKALGCSLEKIHHKLRLLSDNGPCYIADDLAKWLDR